MAGSRRSGRLLGLILIAGMPGGCTPAATFAEGRMTVKPGFSVAAPDPEVWDLRTNHYVHGEPVVIYRHQSDRVATLTFRLLDVPDTSREVPLEVLAQAWFVTGGVAQGVEAKVSYESPLTLGEASAVATVGTWTVRPLTQEVAQVMVRSPDGLVVITVVSDRERMDAGTRELDRLLRGFSLETEAQIDPFLLETVPFAEPEQDPGHFGP